MQNCFKWKVDAVGAKSWGWKLPRDLWSHSKALNCTEHFGTATYTDTGPDSLRIGYRQLKAVTSSRLNNTPPIGAPKATDTPAAAAADKTYNPKFKISDRIMPLSYVQSILKGMLVVTKIFFLKKLYMFHIQFIKNEVQFIFPLRANIIRWSLNTWFTCLNR